MQIADSASVLKGSFASSGRQQTDNLGAVVLARVLARIA
jgi:hypothetical protein